MLKTEPVVRTLNRTLTMYRIAAGAQEAKESKSVELDLGGLYYLTRLPPELTSPNKSQILIQTRQ
jgi:hypothetical protein